MGSWGKFVPKVAVERVRFQCAARDNQIHTEKRKWSRSFGMNISKQYETMVISGWIHS